MLDWAKWHAILQWCHGRLHLRRTDGPQNTEGVGATVADGWLKSRTHSHLYCGCCGESWLWGGTAAACWSYQQPAGVRPHEGEREQWCGVQCGTAEATVLLKTCVDRRMWHGEQDLHRASQHTHQHSARVVWHAERRWLKEIRQDAHTSVVHAQLLFFNVSKKCLKCQARCQKRGRSSHHRVHQRISHPCQEGERHVCQDLLGTEETSLAAWKSLVLHRAKPSLIWEAMI